MRHNKSHRRLGKPSPHRRSMLRNLATSFLETGRIQTTLHRAKELRPIIEKLITKGKEQTVHTKRLVSSYVFTKGATKAMDSYATRFKDRNGGYTRIVKIGVRFGDGARLAAIELVDYAENEGKVKKV